MTPPCLSGDPAKLDAVIKSHVRPFMEKIETALKASKYIIGDTATMIDFWVVALWTDKVNNKNHPENFKPLWNFVKKDFPCFTKWAESLQAEL